MRLSDDGRLLVVQAASEGEKPLLLGTTEISVFETEFGLKSEYFMLPPDERLRRNGIMNLAIGQAIPAEWLGIRQNSLQNSMLMVVTVKTPRKDPKGRPLYEPGVLYDASSFVQDTHSYDTHSEPEPYGTPTWDTH